MNFSGQQLLTWGSVVFAISGMYYKMLISDVEKEKEDSKKEIVTNQRMYNLEETDKLQNQKISALEQQIRILQDENLKRSTIESSNGYLPFKKK